MIPPSSLIWIKSAGNGNIDHTVETPFAGDWVLAKVQVHFRDIRSAAGASQKATFTMSLDSEDGVEWDATIWKEPQQGIGADVYWFAKSQQEESGYTFHSSDKLKFAWTNPDPPEIGWGMRVALAQASDVR